MAIILYGDELSPPVRAVMLTCKALGIDYEFKKVSLLNGDHLKPEFVKINPLHTVPTIQDGDFVIYDSHAIATYLADKASDDSWYPKDIKKRAIVNQRLHFDNAILFTRIRDMLEPVIFSGLSAYQPEKTQRLDAALELLSNLIQDGGWLTGDKPSIADTCAAASVSTILAVLPSVKVPEKVAAWFKKCEQELPEYQTVNKPGADNLGEIMQSKLKE
ncbi:glutathione S-transferase 1-like [Frankliniella occidentalis]|uniref:Glutathione S-transferase 1-like n=1 Tax=Frankliniella occidentalis TaxID=133901 RepID=A0A6J1T4N1_FRAOC|nr:glutathione S-transferase 1-like [Frankliniella occidentalis]QXF31016.1 glutathione S-transferase epsilon 1 [Frankliniella occidentalis]